MTSKTLKYEEGGGAGGATCAGSSGNASFPPSRPPTARGRGASSQRESRAPYAQSPASAGVRRAGGGELGAIASAAPIPILAPPRAPAHLPLPRPPPPPSRVKSQPESTLPGSWRPAPPAGCDPPSNVRALGARPSHSSGNTSGALRASKSPRYRTPAPNTYTLAASRDHTHDRAHETTPARSGRPAPPPAGHCPAPRRGRPLGGTQTALSECACAGVQ